MLAGDAGTGSLSQGIRLSKMRREKRDSEPVPVSLSRKTIMPFLPSID